MIIIWKHTEFGHDFFVELLDTPDKKGRNFRLYDNGYPSLGGQWHYTLENAQSRAQYVLQGSYVNRIAFLEQRVQKLEAKLAQ